MNRPPPHSWSESREIVVLADGELRPGETKKFTFAWRGQQVEAFVLNFRGALHAYVNECCHIPMTLDWVENQFFTADGEYIQCATHGACYVPTTGECVSGPPCGKFLRRIPLRVEAGKVLAVLPPNEAAE